jgi:double-stranded uracil-DNA glycosylase
MSHRILEEWMRAKVETLADLIPSDPRILCVGINPAPISVAAGHYYQGQLGQRFFARLRKAGILPGGVHGYEDDIAYEMGIGFTDVVKRPTASATEVSAEELRHGATILTKKLEVAGAPLVVFAFKGAAVQLLGPFAGNGFLPDAQLGPSQVYVMPGPYERRDTVDQTLGSLAHWWQSHG